MCSCLNKMYIFTYCSTYTHMRMDNDERFTIVYNNHRLPLIYYKRKRSVCIRSSSIRDHITSVKVECHKMDYNCKWTLNIAFHMGHIIMMWWFIFLFVCLLCSLSYSSAKGSDHHGRVRSKVARHHRSIQRGCST